MGHVLSSDTIYAVAYLTEKGRKYLFDPITNNRFASDGQGGTIDAFKIAYFSMSDPDYNYNIISGESLETGDIPNISGKNDDCIKGTIVSLENKLISLNGQVSGVGNDPMPSPDTEVPYMLETNLQDNIITMNLNTIPVLAGI